ncbi:hypothetical protein HMPREF9372_3338 [Sporosarcina newyorkensis 2681]|uniref:XkdX family protein n=1 Tax=Sporosarcina newyorkensis 2681 TaxID=1027292 RepID=F9DX07_9BACL|nr:XkdX family protein [Sporosarcina newyorkensis]EGQ21301.1 hypothetical protein HMPREF9372_3338 [Sporosarcina newyorkensis 2681]
MDWFNTIKRFYPRFWDEKMVGDAVVCEKITADQYKEITGLTYGAEDNPAEPEPQQETEEPAPKKK